MSGYSFLGVHNSTFETDGAKLLSSSSRKPRDGMHELKVPCPETMHVSGVPPTIGHTPEVPHVFSQLLSVRHEWKHHATAPPVARFAPKGKHSPTVLLFLQTKSVLNFLSAADVLSSPVRSNVHSPHVRSRYVLQHFQQRMSRGALQY